jgi:hypothetical protein
MTELTVCRSAPSRLWNIKKLSIISGEKQILPAVMQYRYLVRKGPKPINDS